MPGNESTPRGGRIVITDADVAETSQVVPPVAAPAAPVVQAPVMQAPAAPAAATQQYAAAPPPPIVPGMPSTGPAPRGWLPRWQVAVPAVLLSILLIIGAFFLGQSTRQSDAEIAAALVAQKAELVRERRSDLRDQARDLRREYREALERRLASAEAKARESGRAVGINEGRAGGYSSGFTNGTCYTPGTLRYVC